MDIGQEKLIGIVPLDGHDQSTGVRHEARTACSSGKVGELMGEATFTWHEMDVSLDAEGNPISIWRPGRDFVVPVGSQGTVSRNSIKPASLCGNQEYVRKGFAILDAG